MRSERGSVGVVCPQLSRLVEYDPSWPAAYDAERERLALLAPGVRIHHIGSSAVPGLAGKAVIDTIALVADLDADSAALIQRAGYELPARFNVNLVHRRFLCYPTALSHASLAPSGRARGPELVPAFSGQAPSSSGSSRPTTSH